MRSSRIKFVALLFGALGLLAAACGGSDDSGSGGSSGGPAKIKLTLQWVTQAQFAGYHAALDQGFYADENLDVTIQPGDYVLGDIDGVLIIPQAIIQEVVEQTVAVATKEDVVRASLQDGGNIRELFEEYKVF